MNDKERFDRFTKQARKVLSLAQEEAQRFNHNYIGTEHLLLGLIRERDGVAATVLRTLGVELNKVRGAVEFIKGRGERIVLSDIGLSSRAKKVLELATDEALRLNHRHIGTEHVLLGLMREGEGTAVGVLASLGVGLEKVRSLTIVLLNQSGRPPLHPPLVDGSWSLPALSTERLVYIQAEMQNTFRIGDHDPSESLEATQGRARKRRMLIR
jgi:ATP-dependent Clp protease ATP-binding subunit ClpC